MTLLRTLTATAAVVCTCHAFTPSTFSVSSKPMYASFPMTTRAGRLTVTPPNRKLLNTPSSLFASVVVDGPPLSDDGNSRVNPIRWLIRSFEPSGSDGKTEYSLSQYLASTMIFIGLDVLFRKAFLGLGIKTFPSTLGGCGVLFASMLALPTIGPQMYTVLKPGATLLAKWLQVLLVPSLVRLPLAPSFGSTLEATKAATIIFGGFVVSLVTTAWSVLAVRRLTNRSCEQMPHGPNCAKPVSPNQTNVKAFSDGTAKRLRLLTAASGVGALLSSTLSLGFLTQPMAAAFMLFSTANNFVFGARLPKKLTKILHPLVTCTTLTWLSAYLLGAATGGSFHSVIRAYKAGSLALGQAGAGDLLLFLLGPAIVSLSVSMYDRRKLMRENMAEVGTSIAASSVGGLFGTAALVRLFGLGSAGTTVALSLLSRNITSALAMVAGAILGADVSLTVSIAIVTGLLGANFGSMILDALKIRDPVARGLAIGSSSHGLGTAAIAHEKDAFPFAAVAMTLVAAFSAALVSVPQVKLALIRLALGA